MIYVNLDRSTNLRQRLRAFRRKVGIFGIKFDLEALILTKMKY